MTGASSYTPNLADPMRPACRRGSVLALRTYDDLSGDEHATPKLKSRLDLLQHRAAYHSGCRVIAQTLRSTSLVHSS